ncbi:restriction endonuclease subunit S [uncultured Microscilla sp.]|uniref:restriction endonuclease subunit S n=1 Tax=uncultured Microscilla sp. TaxID=432653 RepID=UPI0026205DEC|nr:restriction endonuclease subunit S [uncultured Microscilla sp.]
MSLSEPQATYRKANKWQYLKALNYAQVAQTWDVQFYKADLGIRSRFDQVKLSEVIKQRKVKIKKEAYQYDIPLVDRIPFESGSIVLRDPPETNTDLWQANKNDLILSQPQFHKGGVAVNTLADKIVCTTNYRVYGIDAKVVAPTYLWLYLRSEAMQQILQALSTGSVRAQFPLRLLPSQTLVLPPLAQQKEIVKAYESSITKAEELGTKAEEYTQQLSEYPKQALGQDWKKPELRKQGKHLQILNFAKTKDWSLAQVEKPVLTSKYDLVELKELIKLKSGKALSNQDLTTGLYPVYGANGQKGNYGKFTHEGERLIIGRVGAQCGNTHLVTGKYWVDNNAFVADKLSEKISWQYLKITLDLLDLNQLKTGTGQPSINQKTILGQLISVPPLNIQEEIVQEVERLRQTSEQLQQKSKDLREQALTDFEKAVFN